MKMTTTFTSRRRRRQRKRVLDIALSSLLLQRRPVVRRVRGARYISSPHLLIDETLRYTTNYARGVSLLLLYTPRAFLCAFLKEGKEEDTREKKMKKKDLIP